MPSDTEGTKSKRALLTIADGRGVSGEDAAVYVLGVRGGLGKPGTSSHSRESKLRSVLGRRSLTASREGRGRQRAASSMRRLRTHRQRRATERRWHRGWAAWEQASTRTVLAAGQLETQYSVLSAQRRRPTNAKGDAYKSEHRPAHAPQTGATRRQFGAAKCLLWLSVVVHPPISRSVCLTGLCLVFD